MRRHGMRITETSQMRSDILRRQPKDIRPFRFVSSDGQPTKCECQKENAFGHVTDPTSKVISGKIKSPGLSLRSKPPAPEPARLPSPIDYDIGSEPHDTTLIEDAEDLLKT